MGAEQSADKAEQYGISNTIRQDPTTPLKMRCASNPTSKSEISPNNMFRIYGPDYERRVHYEAPPSDRIAAEMDRFIAWYGRVAAMPDRVFALTWAGIAHPSLLRMETAVSAGPWREKRLPNHSWVAGERRNGRLRINDSQSRGRK